MCQDLAEINIGQDKLGDTGESEEKLRPLLDKQQDPYHLPSPLF
jgi:hypothetical protein